MHAAPSVQVAFGPDRTARVLSTALAAVATLDLLSWFLSWIEVDPVVQWAAALAAAAGAAVASWRWTRRWMPGGVLAWNGRVWTLEQAAGVPMEGRALVALDLDRWMLLRFDPVLPDRRAWIPLSQATAEAAWAPLRSALYSSSRADAPPPAVPPA